MADLKAQPPGGGRQDHAAMRAASMLPVAGSAGSDTLAANGALEVPGREPQSSAAVAGELETITPAPEPIPGAYERDTLTHREPGAIGGRFNGADSDRQVQTDDQRKGAATPPVPGGPRSA